MPTSRHSHKGTSADAVGFGCDELNLLLRWSSDFEAMGRLAEAMRLRWRAFCAFTGCDPESDPAENALFCALEWMEP